ncbi:MAG: acyl-CoA thioesterase II, partial [Leucobacter sp.]|nr:acyl-CoA thioesterase II [Leucobacter sp.]
MSAAMSLKQVFDLTPLDDDRWAGRSDGINLPQVFGGQLVAQSLIAATKSIDEGRLP